METLLRARDLAFSYGEQAVLRGVSLALGAGEVVTLLGPNGSGKSTLIRALLGQHRASGAIEWDRKPLHAWRRRDLARRVAYLPQAPSAEGEQTVGQVLRLGRAPYWRMFGIESDGDERVVREVAESLALSEMLRRPMAELSAGQRPRVFVGRCLVQQPAAMLLDEPGTYLDLKHQVDLLRLLKELTRQRSLGVLMTSHEINLAAAYADRMILLSAGQVVAMGIPGEVMRPDVLGPVYGVPLRAISGESRPLVFPVV